MQNGLHHQMLLFLRITSNSWVSFWLLRTIGQVSKELERKLVECVLQSGVVHTGFFFEELKNGYHNQSYLAPDANLQALMFVNCLQDVSMSMLVKTSVYNLEAIIKDYFLKGKHSFQHYISHSFGFMLCWHVSGFTYVKKKLIAHKIHILMSVLVVLKALYMFLDVENKFYITYVKQKLTAHKIHILMGVLVALKVLYMFLDAENKFYIKKIGTPHGWDVAFYGFSFLKGMMPVSKDVQVWIKAGSAYTCGEFILGKAQEGLDVVAWEHTESEDTIKQTCQHQSFLEVNTVSKRTRESGAWLTVGFIVEMVRVTVQATKQRCWVKLPAKDMNLEGQKGSKGVRVFENLNSHGMPKEPREALGHSKMSEWVHIIEDQTKV
ncbi:hypothetical protein L7F22_063902 [Adiantum nelumboides]|nr:hypothetical protein [Adiantum nelumboides]